MKSLLYKIQVIGQTIIAVAPSVDQTFMQLKQVQGCENMKLYRKKPRDILVKYCAFKAKNEKA